jgi:drug/metabolite transporter (DMT)-like permease
MSQRRRGILAVIVATCGWGTTPVIIRLLGHASEYPQWFGTVPDLDPYTQTIGRYGVALIVLLLMGLFSPSMRLRRLKGRYWLWMLVPGMPNIVMQVCWVNAYYHRIMPTMGMLLSELSLVLSLAFTYAFFRDERHVIGSRSFLLLVLLALGAAAGVVVMAPLQGAELPVFGLGVLFICGSSLFWAFYSVGIKFATQRKQIPSGPAFLIASVYMVAAFAVMTAFAGGYEKLAQIGWRLSAVVALGGCVNIAIPHVLYYYAIRRLGIATAALVTLCATFVTAAVSFAVFGEMLTLGQIGFGAVLMASAGAAVWLGEVRRGRAVVRRGLDAGRPPTCGSDLQRVE